MRLAYHSRWTCGLLAALGVAALLAFAPSRPAGADDGNVTFFTGPSPCPIAHCNQHLDGR